MLFYEDRQVGLGADFHARVTETMIAIGKDPLRFPIYEGKRVTRPFRRARVQRFPYVIVFEARPDEVVVVAVAHSSQ